VTRTAESLDRRTGSTERARAFVSQVAPSSSGDVRTIDDHRQNNCETYIYASKDYGRSWNSINGDSRVKRSNDHEA
jgi:hypothetical protein